MTLCRPTGKGLARNDGSLRGCEQVTLGSDAQSHSLMESCLLHRTAPNLEALSPSALDLDQELPREPMPWWRRRLLNARCSRRVSGRMIVARGVSLRWVRARRGE
eukprot:scaffold103827_cov29-Tisochrysis_lutea.AAC.5